MNWKCKSCGEYFDEPVTEQGYLAEAWGHPIYESYHTCPCCGSDELEYKENGFYDEAEEEGE